MFRSPEIILRVFFISLLRLLSLKYACIAYAMQTYQKYAAE